MSDLRNYQGIGVVVDVNQYETSGGQIVTRVYIVDDAFRPQRFVVYGSSRVAPRWAQDFKRGDIVEYDIQQELAHFDNGTTGCTVMDRTKLKHHKE